MVALGATIIVRGPGGERRIAAKEFFTGIYETALSPQELLVAVELPVARKNSAHFFHEFARRHGDYAIVGLAAQAIVEGGQFADLRLGFFAVGDRPLLARAAGKLVDVAITPAVLAEAPPRWAKSSILRRISRRHPPCAGIWRRYCWRVACPRCLIAPISTPGHRRDGCGGDFTRSQWRARRSACAAAPESGGFSARASQADRHACRLRARGLRRMHGARQWRDRALLPDAGGADAECVGRDDRGVVRQRRDCRSAGCFPRPQRTAMRLLYAGNADGGAGSAEAIAEPDREQIREHLSGNYCRCTGYQAIVDAIETTARARAGRTP